MLKVDTLSLGSYQTNCYIVRDACAKSCAVIDPGYSPEVILQHLKKEGLSLDAVLLTHGHFDHVGAVEALVEATGCQLWMHEGDYSQFPNPTNAYFYPLANSDFTEVQFCEDFEQITAGGLTFTVWSTPGHTWGSVCYLCENVLFCGDTLFADSCGRTDLPGGDLDAMKNSLQRLSTAPSNYRVCPGHGVVTTLGREQQYNPYMRGCL
jgi:glyoxylase-like metal-dependent hydrolase (beta-lactamase superfamily II)